RLVAARPWQARSAGARSGPPRLVDVAIATAALAGSLALVTHGGGLTGVVHSRTSSLDAARVVLVTLATVPLVARRRSPPGASAPSSPNSKPRASGSSRSPRNAPASPATCTTPPATRST